MPSLEQIISHPKNSFSASHFLIKFGKCDRLHGHNYHVTVQLQYDQIDLSIPIDFRKLNNAIQQEIQLLDQKILLPQHSPEIQILSTLKGKNWGVSVDNKYYSFPKQDVLLMDGVEQITTENLAIYLHQKLGNWFRREGFSRLVKSLEVLVTENLGNQSKFSAPI
ncbi:MAG: 6-carboxytetrahydropterin synthase [Candidatus Heimdallarchaeota archaeon]|nr:MAG: 6-carboxytetrahydropterin synthase [Candidatus Heimdallarchaeota archaeon]